MVLEDSLCAHWPRYLRLCVAASSDSLLVGSIQDQQTFFLQSLSLPVLLDKDVLCQFGCWACPPQGILSQTRVLLQVLLELIWKLGHFLATLRMLTRVGGRRTSFIGTNLLQYILLLSEERLLRASHRWIWWLSLLLLIQEFLLLAHLFYIVFKWIWLELLAWFDVLRWLVTCLDCLLYFLGKFCLLFVRVFILFLLLNLGLKYICQKALLLMMKFLEGTFIDNYRLANVLLKHRLQVFDWLGLLQALLWSGAVCRLISSSLHDF